MADNSSHSDDISRLEDLLTPNPVRQSVSEIVSNFRNALFSQPDNEDLWGDSLSAAAKCISADDETRPHIFQVLLERFPQLLAADVSSAIDNKLETSVEGYRYESALSSLAPAVEADFDIHDVLPKGVANVIQESCDHTQVDWKSSVFMMLAVTAGLVGNRTVVVSPRSSDPISLAIHLFVCGDTSTNKSIVSKKFVNPLVGCSKLERLKREAALAEAAKITDTNDKALTILQINSNRTDVMSQLTSFSAEGLAFDVTKRAPRNGYHIHQEEGGGILACEKWGSTQQKEGTNSVGLFRKTLMESWDGPLDGEFVRASQDRCSAFRNQSVTLTANLQMQFVPEIIDFDEDGLGWTSRMLLVEAQALDNERAPRKREGPDPITKFLNQRLIPFTQGIEIRKTGQVDPTGFLIDYVLLELDPWGEAVARYEEFCGSTLEIISKAEKNEVEPSFVSFLKKAPVRMMKFAALLHILQTLEGKQIPHQGEVHDYPMYVPSCDPNLELTKNGGITSETLERAIKLELIARKQYQQIADKCRTAPARRVARKELGEALTQSSLLLEKLKGFGSISQREFIDRCKTRKISRVQLRACLDQLVREGKVERTEGKRKGSFVLAFKEEIRS